MRVKIVTFVPLDSADKVREAPGLAGAGRIGEYSFCSFSTRGQGRYLPSSSAHPAIGQPDKLETVDEERIEVVCDRVKAREVVKLMKQAHPYEEVAYDIVPILELEDL